MAKLAVKKSKSVKLEGAAVDGGLLKLKDGRIQKNKTLKKSEITAAALGANLRDALSGSLTQAKPIKGVNATSLTVKKFSLTKKSLTEESKKVPQKSPKKPAKKEKVIKIVEKPSLDQSVNGVMDTSVSMSQPKKVGKKLAATKSIPNGTSPNGQIKPKAGTAKLGRFEKLKGIEEARKKKQLKHGGSKRTAAVNGDIKISLDDLQPELNGTLEKLPKLAKKLSKKGKGGKQGPTAVKNADTDTDSDDEDTKEDEAMCKAYKNNFGFDDVVDKVIEEQNKEEDEQEEQKLKEANNKKKRTERDPLDHEKSVEVKNVSVKTNKKVLLRIFKTFGKVESIRFRNLPVKSPKKKILKQVMKKTLNEGRSSMSAFVKFADPESAKNALKANVMEVEGHHIFVKSCVLKTQHEMKEDLKRGCTIFAGNLTQDVEEEALYKHFLPCGPIVNINVCRKDLKSNGTAFIEFQTKEAVSKALKLAGSKMGSREIRVTKAVRKAKKNSSGPRAMKAPGGKAFLKQKVGGASATAADSQPGKKSIQSRLSRPGQAAGATTAGPGTFTGNKFDQPMQGAAKRLKDKKTKLEIKKIMLAKKLTANQKRPNNK